jgi:hypothetical protein
MSVLKILTAHDNSTTTFSEFAKFGFSKHGRYNGK